MKRSDDVEQLAVLAEQSADTPTLLDEMLGLRRDLLRTRRKQLRDRVIFFVIMLAFVFLWNGQRIAVDRIEATRAQSRQALCGVLNTFSNGHNRFVEQVIHEREDIITVTKANPATTEPQRQASIAFFQEQINAYRTNIVPTYDCFDRDAVASIFKVDK